MHTCNKHMHKDVYPCKICDGERHKSNTLDKQDVVKNPSHYQFFPDVEAIEIIAMSMSEEGFRGYCLGNRLKYRLRAGKKDDPRQELDKSDFYIKLYGLHKHLCRPVVDTEL